MQMEAAASAAADADMPRDLRTNGTKCAAHRCIDDDAAAAAAWLASKPYS